MRIIKSRDAVARKREARIRMRHGETLHHIRDGGGFGAVAFQEFEARGHRREQIPHLDRRAPRASGRARRANVSRVDGEGVRRAFLLVPRNDIETRHGRDRRQRLAAEAEGRDGEEVLVRKLRGGMTLDRQDEVVGIHAVSHHPRRGSGAGLRPR